MNKLLQKIKCFIGIHNYGKWNAFFAFGGKYKKRICIYCGEEEVEFIDAEKEIK